MAIHSLPTDLPTDLDRPLPPLNLETIQGILDEVIDDETIHRWVWLGLGYRWRPEEKRWDATGAPADWQTDYPEPPAFVESRPATVKLTRSIAAPHKQLLKEQLGFKGYQISELVPRKTRRATMANWLLAYLALNQQIS